MYSLIIMLFLPHINWKTTSKILMTDYLSAKKIKKVMKNIYNWNFASEVVSRSLCRCRIGPRASTGRDVTPVSCTRWPWPTQMHPAAKSPSFGTFSDQSAIFIITSELNKDEHKGIPQWVNRLKSLLLQLLCLILGNGITSSSSTWQEVTSPVDVSCQTMWVQDLRREQVRF